MGAGEGGGGGGIVVGIAATLALQPVDGVRFAAAPACAVKAGSFAGRCGFRAARAGTYRVALDSGLWVDVAGGGKPIAARTHGHWPACAGVRK